MSAETRFRTLVTHTTAIYASSPENRASLLKEGLFDLVNVIKPTDARSWAIVKTDSERLLRVWTSVEEDSYYANTIANQLWDLLEELAAGSPTSVPAPVPTSVPTSVPVSTASPSLVISDTILHIQDDVNQLEETEETEETEEAEEVEETEEEVEETEETEEAEEALEVEQMFIRGRSYWVDVNTKKLYADVNEEVGDEVGVLVNGKPVFLSPK